MVAMYIKSGDLAAESIATFRLGYRGESNGEDDREAMEVSRLQRAGDIRILIANEQPIYAESLRALLEKQSDFRIAGVAHDITTTVRMSQEQKPDILLLNVKASGKIIGKPDGMSVLEEIQSLKIEMRPLLLVSLPSSLDLMGALVLGARGVVLKTSTSQTLIDGIRGVMLGQYWICEEAGKHMIEVLREHAQSRNGKLSSAAFGLTARELQIVSTVVSGYSNGEIAREYAISEQTVKHHLSNIFDKLGVFNRIELALFAMNHHLCEES
jgi:two-component system nitrate/nitrite response regulator NarL